MPKLLRAVSGAALIGVLSVSVALAAASTPSSAAQQDPTPTLTNHQAIQATATTFAQGNPLPTSTPRSTSTTAPSAAATSSLPPAAIEPLARQAEARVGPVTINTASPEVSVLVAVEPGDVLTIDLTSTNMDPFLRVQDADGNALAEDDDSGDGFDSRLEDFTVPDGLSEIVVLMSNYGYAVGGAAGAEGSLTLTVVNTSAGGIVSVPPTPVLSGTYDGATLPRADVNTVDVVIGPDAAEVRVPVEVQAGDLITIDLTSDTADTYLILEDADGSTLTRDDDGGESLNSRISAFEVLEDGTLFVVVTTYSVTVGNNPVADDVLTLTVENLTLTGNMPVVAEDVAVEATLPEVVEAEMEAGTAIIVDFEGQAGQMVIIRVQSDAIDSTVRLLDPADVEISYDDDGAGFPNSLLGPVMLETDGLYRAVVRDFGDDSAGPVTVTLVLAEVVTLEADTPVEVAAAGGDLLLFAVPADANGTLANVLVTGPTQTRVLLRDGVGLFNSDTRDLFGADDVARFESIQRATDQFVIVLLPADVPSDALVTVTLETVEIADLGEGPVTLELVNSRAESVFVFNAVANETVRLVVTSTRPSTVRETARDANITLSLSMDGQGEIGYVNTYGVEGAVVDVTAPVDGLVSVRASVSSFALASVTITLERLAPPATATATVTPTLAPTATFTPAPATEAPTATAEATLASTDLPTATQPILATPTVTVPAPAEVLPTLGTPSS